jgi:hypothetical protein
MPSTKTALNFAIQNCKTSENESFAGATFIVN